ncbi:hypothetical protein B0H11DRAFT_2243287 [Mycena galericulata]|nr:hypothetical protein B0H11DRAFT_2243287 [Mycena galericulata]
MLIPTPHMTLPPETTARFVRRTFRDVLLSPNVPFVDDSSQVKMTQIPRKSDPDDLLYILAYKLAQADKAGD